MSLGQLQIMDLFVVGLRTDLNVLMLNQLSVMHCAAQTYAGFLSILYMSKRADVDVNLVDERNATPLHFAVVKCECKNVELLIKLGANLDAQDFQGNTALHIAVIRATQSPEKFDDYKRIIKELLFNGADRTIKSAEESTPYELF